jgi:hypothetical protein
MGVVKKIRLKGATTPSNKVQRLKKAAAAAAAAAEAEAKQREEMDWANVMDTWSRRRGR